MKSKKIKNSKVKEKPELSDDLFKFFTIIEKILLNKEFPSDCIKYLMEIYYAFLRNHKEIIKKCIDMDNKLSQNLIKDKMNKDFKENMDKIYSKLIAAKGKNFFSYISYSNRYSMLEIPNDTNLNERELTFINNKFYNNYFNNSITLIIYQSKAKIFSSKNKENLLKIVS